MYNWLVLFADYYETILTHLTETMLIEVADNMPL